MAEKSTNKERLKEITARIEQGVKEVFTSEKYAAYLRTMSRFHHYSTNNRLLIYSQNPNATHVAGFQAWRNKFGRHVVKGAKGITIIAPTPYKKKIEEEKLDPDTKLPMLDENGEVITEEKEIKIPMYKPVTVFDISQTDGKPLPELAETLMGDVQNYDVFMEAVKLSSPAPIIMEPMQQNMDGYFSLAEQNIHLRESMSEVQTVCAAIHEITHAKLHNTNAEEQKSHKVEEIQAESVAYAVCAYYGIETAANSFGYLANYTQGKSIEELKNSLDLIGRTADEIISDIDRHYAELMKEREAEVNADDLLLPEMPEMILESTPDPSIPFDVMRNYGYTDADMLPLSKDRALELAERDVTVYMLYSDNTEAMVFDTEDIINFDGLFGIAREDWDVIKTDISVHDVEQRFLNNPADAMAVYQLKQDAPAELRFIGLEKLNSPPDKTNYVAVYTRDLVPDDDTARILENFYYIFNDDRPVDFTGHSLSVSDVIALKREGVVSYHYCDSIGFVELPDFDRENPLKNAELLLEDDYSMLDGRINNGKSALAEDKKPSVLDQLKAKETVPKIPKSTKKSRENER